jgi:hypothetical protein
VSSSFVWGIPLLLLDEASTIGAARSGALLRLRTITTV